jgi:hypothetical protein
MAPKKNVFVEITNQQVYNELSKFREENEKQHQDILMALETQKACNNNEHEKIRGSINLVKATMGGVVTIVGAVGLWVLGNLK